MGYISGMFAQRVAEIATADLPSRSAFRDLCRKAGLDADSSVEPGQMIRDTAFFDMLEYVAREYPDGRSIAIRVGASMRCDDYGAFGLAFKSAVNLRGSFQRVERYGKIVTSIANFVIESGDRTTFMSLVPDKYNRLGTSMTRELAIAAATAISREVCNKHFVPDAVFFSHAAPADLSAQEAHFQCAVHYDADRDGLEVSTNLLDANNRLGDARISEFFDSHLETELAQYKSAEQLDARVRYKVAELLSEGVPKLSDIAIQLGMSDRTLQRRLAAQGHTYQELVDTARRDLADNLLRRTGFGLAEIAFLTGYSEQSTFTRAFKRWYGRTPASYRRSSQKL